MQNELRQANNLTMDQQLIVASLSMEVYLIYHGMIGPFFTNAVATFFRNEIDETYQDMKQKCTSVEATAVLDALHHLVLDTFSAPSLNPFDPDALFRETDPTVKQQHIEALRQRIQLVPEELRDFLLLVGKFYNDIHDVIHDDTHKNNEAWLRAREFWEKKLPGPLKVPFWNSFAWNVDVMTPLAGFSNPTEG